MSARAPPPMRRILAPGSARATARYTLPGEDVASLNRRGPLAAQEYLQALLESGCRAADFCPAPPSINEFVWMFENIRQFVTDLNALTVCLLPACSAATCPTMCATDEWQYLCAAHRAPRECCAVDYMVHTLDGTSTTLASDKSFPSRTEIGADSVPYFQSIMRRLYRIFSHAFFHHLDVFTAFEAAHHSYERFVLFSKAHNLLTEDQFIVPPSAFSA